jgi:biopolymer transport protein ExbD
LYKKLRKIYEDPTTDLNQTAKTDAAQAVAPPAPADETDLNTVGEKKKPLLFLCDKQHTFRSINHVIKTAGMAGFPNFQFAVLKK